MGKSFTSLFKPALSPRGRNACSSATMSCSGSHSNSNSSSSSSNNNRSDLAGVNSTGVDAGNCGPFSARQVKKLKDAFDFFDMDNDGRISGGELRKVLRFLGNRVSEAETARIIAEVDLNCNGTVEFNEFVTMMAEYHRKSQTEASGQQRSAEEAEIMEAFQAFDHNGDSYIDFAELKKTMKFLGEGVTDEEVECMIREADIDRDGRIDYEEFKKLLASMKQGI